MKMHMMAFFIGYVLDLLLGDPYSMPHPIRLIGNMIAALEKRLYPDPRDAGKEKAGGLWLVIIVLLVTTIVTVGLVIISYRIHIVLGIVVESWLTYWILAARCLEVESMKVYHALKKNDLSEARTAVSMIVGRDTAQLDAAGITKAAVETVAENTSDGVIAPMIYTALGGPALGFFYKAANTMDSMIAYKNDRYIYFGRCAAKLDDLLNYIPARISAGLMVIAACISGKDFSGKNAWRIFKRDRYQHASPNSAQTESVCAGALGIKLAGDASYFGKIVKKPTIGDSLRQPEYEDIKRINKLMFVTEALCVILCLAVMCITIYR